MDIVDSADDVHDSDVSSKLSSINSTIVGWSESATLIDLSFSSTSKEDRVDIVDSIVDLHNS